MKRCFYFFVLITLSVMSNHARAQWINHTSLSFGPEFVAPFPATNNSYNSNGYYRSGGGFSAQLELPVVAKLNFTFSVGYMFYVPTNRDYVYTLNPLCGTCGVLDSRASAPLYTYVPFIAGLRYYAAKYLFISAESGKAIKGNSATVASYVYGGGLGGYVPLDYHNSIDMSADVERGFKSADYDYPVSQLAIKVAFKHRF